MLWAAFVGQAYRARSETIAADALLNMYCETTETPTEAKKSTLYGTPGLKNLLTVGNADTVSRGGFSQDGRTFMVVGDGLYEVNVGAATATLRGAITNDGLPVSFASNGRGGEQLAIVGGGELKILTLTTNALSAAVTLPLTNAPVMIDFIDAYFVMLEADSIRVWFSALENGASWDGLDYFARSETSDNLVGIKVIRNRVWVFGSLTSEVYYNSGDVDTPFVFYPGSLMQEGAVTPWGITTQGEQVMWLAQDNQGKCRMVSASDYAPAVISTPPVSFAISSYSSITDAEVLAYEQEGHSFVAWTFPSGGDNGVTWCYDVREQGWHQRSTWNSALGRDERWMARGFAADPAGLVVGDYTTGNLYTLDLDTFTDNAGTIRRLRRTPYISAENQWMFVDRFELGIQAGVGAVSGQGVSPELMLSISRDSGHTWTAGANVIIAGIGAVGEYTCRAIWRRLGRVRADRLVIEVTMTDPVRAVFGPGAWLRVTPGTGAL